MRVTHILALVAIAVSCAFLGSGGCSSATRPYISDDPLNDLVNPQRTARQRTSIMAQLPDLIASGRVQEQAAIERLKTVAWAREMPSTLRESAMIALISDRALLDEGESIAFLRELLPTENDQRVTQFAVGQAALRGWDELTPAIVRRFAVPSTSIADERRPENAALAALHPNRPVEETVFEVFRTSGEADGTGRLRRDAWNLLSRLDESGDIRVRLLGDLASATGRDRSDPTLDALGRALLDLRTIPLTGEELEWLVQLSGRDHRGWWSETQAIVRTLDPDQLRGLRIRHMEPLRWAAEFRRDWTRVSKTALLEVLGEEIAQKETYKRRSAPGVRENLEAWSDTLSYGDAVALMAVSEAVREPRVIEAFFTQAAEDAADSSTEYGGVLRLATSRTSRGMFTAVSYPPRPSIREGDTSFVASRELLEESATALAHYHFHAQRVRNTQFAGPSQGDLNYAALYGRTCVVLTSVDEGVMNVDVYFPNGAVIDLGTINERDGR
ncbi:MAG: hypothetical protein AAFN41_00635 [Planctomycetota bacterium]